VNISFDALKIDIFKEQLARGETVPIRVFGSSMWPFLKGGDTVEVRSFPFAQIAPGDIIVTGAQGRVICHRLLTKNSSEVWTKADAFIGIDAPVPRDHVLGKVIAKVVDGHIVPLNTPYRRVVNRVVLYLTFVLALAYPFLRWLKWRFKIHLS